MKNLVLIRHGKSSWELPIRDHDRPLTKRGISDAHLISDKLKNYLPKKFLIWSSTARRTLDTAKIVAQNLLIPEELVVQESAMYTFDCKSLSKLIKSINNQHNNLILFCHNNAITDFVNKFGDTYIENVPTSGVVFLEFEQDDWNDIQNGKVVKTIFPKHLKNEAKASE
ncbi:SixA phosphatase family protein [Flavobacterium sp. I3-2]|uniref:SixA phosphatase family protein n=1 Tax=Flavobacterium sp. I3-2 TaxID=2748319 RepID=UPI0015ADB91B|nr:histidine phosphatase family protein [Flavobacterium sp. I3-2]